MDEHGTIGGGDDPALAEVAGVVGSDEHRHAFVEVFDSNRVVERVENCLVADAVAVGGIDDERLIHLSQVTLSTTGPQANLLHPAGRVVTMLSLSRIGER